MKYKVGDVVIVKMAFGGPKEKIVETVLCWDYRMKGSQYRWAEEDVIEYAPPEPIEPINNRFEILDL